MKLIFKTFAAAVGFAMAATAALTDDTNKICPIMVDDEIDEWTLDELELSADLASVRAASTRSEAWLGMGHD